jgi:hypothetical protein
MGASRTRSEYLNKTWIIQNGCGYLVPPTVSLTAHLAGSRSSRG